MDSYVDLFQSHGASLVTLAKGFLSLLPLLVASSLTLAIGNRSDVVRRACQKYGGFYLGSIGGQAANLAKVFFFFFPFLPLSLPSFPLLSFSSSKL
jgi:fumarate hydratase, class I